MISGGVGVEQTEAKTAVNGRAAQSVSTGTPGVSGALLTSGYRRVIVCDRHAELHKKDSRICFFVHIYGEKNWMLKQKKISTLCSK